MSMNRKWVSQDKLHTLRSTDGSIWICPICKHAMPYDGEQDSPEARRMQLHKAPRHHNKMAIRIPDMVTVGVVGEYTEDGVKIMSEAAIIAEYKAMLIEKITIPAELWFERMKFVELYKDTDKSITYYLCAKCFKLSVCDPANIRRIYHCDVLCTVHNDNFKRWYDSITQ